MKKFLVAYLAGVRNKYILAWILGVPVSLIIITYIIQRIIH